MGKRTTLKKNSKPTEVNMGDKKLYIPKWCCHKVEDHEPWCGQGKRHVEYLLAYEDHTWTTEVHHITLAHDATEVQILAYAHDNLAGLAAYRKVVLWAVYNTEADDEH